jgi:hypothetical protein
MNTLDTARYQFIAAALNGNGVFRPGVSADHVSSTALIKYPRESEAKFARRNEVAWYENHLRAACQRFIGYIAKKPPLRMIGNPLLEAFADDCDWRGNSLDVFWQHFMIDAKARGAMLLLVEGPANEAATLADQMDSRAVPYLVPILPESVLKYETDWRGQISLVEINTTWQGKPAVKGWDTTRWWVRIGEKIMAEDEHNLGLCPVVAFSESGNFPHVGDFAQIADISKRLFNARSELDEILRAQTFSLLVMNYDAAIPGARDSLESAVAQIGTSNALVTPGTTAEFIAPPSGPADIYLKTIAQLEAAIDRVGLNIEIPAENNQQSGVALTIRFQALNGALTSFARQMEDFERRVWAVACRWLDLPLERVTVEWSKDYALADLKQELETLGAMQLSAFPDAAVRQQQKQIANLVFATASPDTQQEIIDAIDEGGTEVMPTDPPEIGAGETANALPAPTAAAPAPAPTIDMQPVADAIAALKPPVVNVKVDAPVVNVTVPEQQAAPAPAPAQIVPQAPVVFNTAGGAKVIELQRDDAGNVTGASVKEAA